MVRNWLFADFLLLIKSTCQFDKKSHESNLKTNPRIPMNIFGFSFFEKEPPNTFESVREELRRVNYVLNDGYPSEKYRRELRREKKKLETKLVVLRDSRDKRIIQEACSTK